MVDEGGIDGAALVSGVDEVAGAALLSGAAGVIVLAGAALVSGVTGVVVVSGVDGVDGVAGELLSGVVVLSGELGGGTGPMSVFVSDVALGAEGAAAGVDCEVVRMRPWTPNFSRSAWKRSSIWACETSK